MAYVKASEFGEKKGFYLATASGDVNNLPRVGIAGTQGTNEVDDAPCKYGSICLVATGVETSAYMLMPDNNWKKL